MSYLNGVAILCGIVIGACVTYLAVGRQVVAIEEKPAPMVWHDDGSVTPIRAPQAKPEMTAPSVPDGGRVIRTVEVTVLPTHKPTITDHNQPKNDQISKTQDTCEPVKLRLDMTSHADGLRVSMRAEGGEILDAVDIPRDTIYMPRATRHVIALERNGDTTTARYGYSIGALDVGPAVSVDNGRATLGGWIGYRF